MKKQSLKRNVHIEGKVTEKVPCKVKVMEKGLWKGRTKLTEKGLYVSRGRTEG